MTEHNTLVGAQTHIGRANTNSGDPTGVVTPNIAGEILFDTTNSDLYISTGTGINDWIEIAAGGSPTQTLATAQADVTITSGTITDMFTYAMPANTLNTDGDALHIIAWGEAQTNVNPGEVRVQLGSTTLYANTAIVNSSDWLVETWLVRYGATDDRYRTRWENTNASSVTVGTHELSNPSGATTEDYTTALDVKIRGLSSSGGNLVGNGFMVIKYFDA